MVMEQLQEHFQKKKLDFNFLKVNLQHSKMSEVQDF